MRLIFTTMARSRLGGSYCDIEGGELVICTDERIARHRAVIPPDFIVAHEIGHLVLRHGPYTSARDHYSKEMAAHAWTLRRRGRVTPREARTLLSLGPPVGPALRDALLVCARSGRVTHVPP